VSEYGKFWNVGNSRGGCAGTMKLVKYILTVVVIVVDDSNLIEML